MESEQHDLTPKRTLSDSPQLPRNKTAKVDDVDSIPTSRSARTVLAAQRLFAIPELLEPILLDMINAAGDPCIDDLFRLQRVNTSFRDCISKSTVLQRHMGLNYGGLDPPTDIEGLSPAFTLFQERHSLPLCLWDVLAQVHIRTDSTYPDGCTFPAAHYGGSATFISWLPKFTAASTELKQLAAYHDPDGWPSEWSTSLRRRQAATYSLYDRPEASWRNIKMLARPVDCIMEIEVELAMVSYMIPEKYTYTLFWPPGTDSVGALSDAFTRIIRKGEQGNVDCAREQRNAFVNCRMYTREKRIKDWEDRHDRVEVIRGGQTGREEAGMEWMEMKRAHDAEFAGVGCGREEGECHICAAEWHACQWLPDDGPGFY